MSPSTSLAWTVPRTRGNTCTAADGEGREQTGRGESRWGGERADGEGREQMRDGREQTGRGESRQGGKRADEGGKERCEIFALIFDVHMNMLAVAWLC